MTSISLDGCHYAQIFKCLQELDLESLDNITDKSCALPILTKLLLNPFFARRKRVLEIVYKLKRANDMVQLLQAKPIEPHELTAGRESITDCGFESGSPRDRLKIVALEYLRLQELTRAPPTNTTGTSQQHNSHSSTKLHKSNIFDNQLYLDQVSLCLYAVLNRVVNVPVINLLDLVETLLHVKQGPLLVLHLLINFPDRCQEVCQSLITLGESIDEATSLNEISDNRVISLRAICKLNPMMSFRVRALSIQLRLVPSIIILLSLDRLSRALAPFGTPEDEETKSPADLLRYSEELELSYESAITFVIGILQDEQEATRTWFARYIKTAQQKRADQNHDSILTEFRSQLALTFKRLFSVFFEEDVSERVKDFKYNESETDEKFLNRRLIQATATLRYFSALRGIAMLKINQEESESLLNLITYRPIKNETSVNFVTTAVCALFVCSSIINSHKDERRAGDWLKWLLKEYGDDSVCDLLNNIAKHFQTNQINHISELICGTLGMKLQIKAFISKCKQLILQDAFNYKSSPVYPEQDIEKRKSRDRYQAPIKDWIYKKIYEHDEILRVEMVGIRPKSISHDRVDELKRQLVDGFSAMRDDPVALLRVINRILLLPRDGIWTFIEIFVRHWSGILDLETSPETKKLFKAITKLWWRFNTIQPRELWIMTINSLQRTQPLRPYAEMECTWDELTSDPLIVLKCDVRVFRNHRLLDIVLHILSGFLGTSKQSLQDQVDEMPNWQNKDNRSIEELKSTLVLAQTSAAIQILLEYCLPDEKEQAILDKRGEKCDLSDKELMIIQTFDESVDCICQHLHQVFIADTNLAKLVHFQTYPSDLLAITTDKIPSMHICLDYIPELLSQPDLPKQVFVIQLTSHLCEKYAITKSLNGAKLCFNVAFTLLQLLPSDKRAMFYVPALPALLRICKVFPILQEDARLILNQVYQVTLAHMASTSSRLSLSASNPFEGLDKLSWNDVKRLMRGLSLDESLFLCTQKCIIDLEQMELKDKQQHQTYQDDQNSMMMENSQRSAYNTIFAYGSHVI